MTTSATAPAPAAPAAPPRRRPRRAEAVAGLLAGGLVLAGGAGLTLGALQAGEGGFFTTSTASLTTSTSALVTDEVKVEERGPGDPATDAGDLSRVRLRAVGGRPVFLGIGPKAEVEAYLRGAAHDRMSGFDLDPFAVRYERTAGGLAVPPGAQPFWVATATGSGPRTLLWDKERGPWSAVVMNADGSAGVDVRADLGLRFGFLLPGGAVLLSAGLLLAGAVVSARARGRQPLD